MWKKARVRSLDLEGTAFGDVQATLRLVLAALEVILVTRADDGGVTHGLFEQPVEEALLLTSLRDETMYRNFPSVSFFQTVSIRARPRFSQKKPSSNPHPNFPTNFDGSQLAKIQQTRQRNPSHPSSSERSIGRTIRSIDRVGSGRSLVDPGVDRERRRTHRVASRRPSSHHPYRTAHPRRNVTDRARSMAVPRSSSLSRFPHAHRASHPSLASRKRTLPAGFLAETFLVPPRWVFAAATMTRVVLTASICSGSCSRGSFVRVK